MKRTGWRLVPAAYARSAFDGEGARLYGGRWNSVGISMVYASEHPSLAVLELRVHIEATSMTRPYKLIAFEYDDRLVHRLSEAELPKNWRSAQAPPALRRRGDAWVKSGQSVILAVPSAIVPPETNLLINPRHPDFDDIGVGRSVDYSFDTRLFG